MAEELPPAPAPAETPAEKEEKTDPTGLPASMPLFTEEDKLQLVCCYLGLLALWPFIARKDNEYLRFHARQGVALAIIGIACWGCFFIPFIGFIGGAALLVVMALSVVGIVKAFDNKKWKMPIAAEVADKLGL